MLSRVKRDKSGTGHLTVTALVAGAAHRVAGATLPTPLAWETRASGGVAESMVTALLVSRATQRLK